MPWAQSMSQKCQTGPSARASSTTRPSATCRELATADGKLRFVVELVSGVLRMKRVERSGGLEDTVYIMRFNSIRHFESVHAADDTRFEYPVLHEQLEKTVRELVDGQHDIPMSQHR